MMTFLFRSSLPVGLMAAVWIVVALPAANASAIGATYGYEYHDSRSSDDSTSGADRTTFGVHRISLVDTSGILAAIFGGAASCQRDFVGGYIQPRGDHVDSADDYELVEVYQWTGPSQPWRVVPGMRTVIEYAFQADDSVELESSGAKNDFEYSEFRIAIGFASQLETGSSLYIDVNALDFCWRTANFKGRVLYEKFEWRLGLGFGVILFGAGRLGVYGSADLVSVVDAAFDESAIGYRAGAELEFDLGPLVIRGEFELYAWGQGDNGLDKAETIVSGWQVRATAGFEF